MQKRDAPTHREEEECRNLVYDEFRGEIICADTGDVIAERLPVRKASYNITRPRKGTERPVYYFGGTMDVGRMLKVWAVRYLRRRGVNPEAIVEMYKHGVPVKEIAEWLSRRTGRNSLGLIYNVLDYYGVRRRTTIHRRVMGKKNRAVRARLLLEVLKQYYCLGKSKYSISRSLNLPISTVYYIISRVENILGDKPEIQNTIKTTICNIENVDELKEKATNNTMEKEIASRIEMLYNLLNPPEKKQPLIPQKR